MAKQSVNMLTLKHYVDDGYYIDSVERYVRTGFGSGFTKDCFGFADYLAFRPGSTRKLTKLVLVQATDNTNKSHRYKKILENPIARDWAGMGFEIHLVACYLEKKPQVVKVQRITHADFLDGVPSPMKKKSS